MKKRGIYLLSLLALLLMPVMVFADIAAPDVKDPEVITPVIDSKSQIIYADSNLNVTDNVQSSGFMFGNDVNVKGNVNGLAVVAGNTVNVSGEHEYGMYAGNVITINGTINKDLFAAGSNINISSDANLLRDVYLMGGTMKINVPVGRNLRVMGSSLDIRGVTVKGKLVAEVSELLMDENTTIHGDLVYFSKTNVEGLDKASIDGEKIVRESADIKVSVKNTLASVCISIMDGFITMVALFYLSKRAHEKVEDDEVNAKTIATRVGVGFIALIIVPIVSLIALFTGILSPLALILLALYVIGLYLASLFTAYKIGNVIGTKLIKKDNMYLSLIIGIVIVRLLALIPVVGDYFTSLFLLYGLGMEYILVKKEK